MQQGNLTISIGSNHTKPSHTFPVDAFSAIKPEFVSADEKQQFVVGLDDAGQVRRIVSQSDVDRPLVAALVGTWVASGLRIQYADGFVALAKLVRKAASAEKEGSQPPGGAEDTKEFAAAAEAAAPSAEGAAAPQEQQDVFS